MKLWSLAGEVLQALGAHYGPAMEEAAAAAGLPAPAWYGWLLPGLFFAPEPLSVEKLRVRGPYTSPQGYAERLDVGVQRGFLESAGQGEYRITAAGRQAAQSVIGAAYARMAVLQPLPRAGMDRLIALLGRIVEASVAAPEPPGKWSLSLSRRTDPGEGASPVARIDQYLSDLGAYRDDAHLAAWQPSGLSAQAWEALTFIWRGEATSLDELCNKLQRRAYPGEVYAEALADLARRGLVAAEAGIYNATPAGAGLRQAAEDLTDRYFYAPWGCLSESETVELGDLLARLRDGLREAQSA